MKTFGGSVLFLDRPDINTDEIISEKYLVENSKQELQSHLFEDLKIEGFNPKFDISEKKVIITRENFGCGLPRENISCAIEANGIYTIVAPNFAKNFKQTMNSDNILEIELDKKSISDIFHTFANKDTECKIVINDENEAKVKLIAGSLSKSYQCTLGEKEQTILENENWKGFTQSKF